MIPTYKEIRLLANSIQQQAHTLATLRGVKFARALSTNIAVVGRIVDYLDTLTKPNEKYIDFNNERIAICETFCKRSEDGTLLYKDVDGKNSFDVDINDPAFIEQMRLLYEKYAEEIQRHETRNIIYQDVLNNPIDQKWIDQFVKIKEEWIDENITVQQMELIMYFIE